MSRNTNIISVTEKLDEIDSVDYPELKFNKHESTEMPFRYVVEPGTQKPILPEVFIFFSFQLAKFW